MSRKIIGIDLDEVLMDTNAALRQYHNDRFGTSFSRADFSTYYLEDVWGISTDEVRERVHDFTHSPYHDAANPIDGAQAAVAELAQHYELHVVTSRPDDVHAVTLSWVRYHFPVLQNSVHFTSDFHPEKRRPKSMVCRELGIDTFIDDALHHARDVAAAVPTAFLVDAPWNQTDEPLPENVQRVHSWQEIMRHLV